MGETTDPYARLCESLSGLPPGMKVRVPKSDIPGAPFATWRRSVGYHVKGATFRQYRDGCIHVHETPTEWIFHRDRHNPHENLVKHLYHDCRGAFWVCSFVSGAATAAMVAGAALRLWPRNATPWYQKIAGR